jgi:hypothetical protein
MRKMDTLIFKTNRWELWTWHVEGIPGYQLRHFDPYDNVGRRERFRENLSIAEATLLAKALVYGEKP